MPRHPAFAGIAGGLVSAGLYLIIFGFALGIPLMLVPSLPLFMLALHQPPRQLLYALGGATFVLVFSAGLPTTLFFLALIGIPTLLIAPAASPVAPRPVGVVLTDVAVYVALVFAGILLHFAPQGGIQPILAEQLHASFADADAPMLEAIDKLTGTLAYMILAASAWWWVLLLYAHAALANWLLKRQGKAVRPTLALAPFPLPLWLLGALALAGVGSLAGGEGLAFTAKTLLLILLLPYFLLGIALVQVKISAWPSRNLLLFVLYFSTLSLVWPALIIAAVGVWQQCRAVATAERSH